MATRKCPRKRARKPRACKGRGGGGLARSNPTCPMQRSSGRVPWACFAEYLCSRGSSTRDLTALLLLCMLVLLLLLTASDACRIVHGRRDAEQRRHGLQCSLAPWAALCAAVPFCAYGVRLEFTQGVARAGMTRKAAESNRSVVSFSS